MACPHSIRIILLLSAIALAAGCPQGKDDDDSVVPPGCNQTILGTLRVAAELLPVVPVGTAMTVTAWQTRDTSDAGIPTGEGEPVATVDFHDWELPQPYEICGKPGDTMLVAFIDEGNGQFCSQGDLHAFLLVESEDDPVEGADLTFDGTIPEDCPRPEPD